MDTISRWWGNECDLCVDSVQCAVCNERGGGTDDVQSTRVEIRRKKTILGKHSRTLLYTLCARQTHRASPNFGAAFTGV